MNGPHLRTLLVGILIALSVVTSPHVADAKPKPKLLYSVRVNGMALRLYRRVLIAQYNPVLVTISGTLKPSSRKVSRALAVSCLIDVKTAVLPTTLDCSGSFVEQHTRDPGQSKTWSSLGIQTTIESFDGSRLTGTFRGTLDPIVGASGPASVENGKFSVVLNGL